jgi:hypothetical protein
MAGQREPAGFDFVGNQTSGRITRDAASAEIHVRGKCDQTAALAGYWCSADDRGI